MTLTPATLAAALTDQDRDALLRLDPGEWTLGRLNLAATTALLFGYGVPLIVCMGDYAKPSRVGEQVVGLLAREAAHG